jgi:hypothetical protein
MHKTKQKEAEAIGLRKLCDKIAFSLLFINGLLVLIIYLLQLHKRLLSFDFQPYGKVILHAYLDFNLTYFFVKLLKDNLNAPMCILET